ncbi:MAG: hypothetical protein ABFD64_09885 [Armatimonadota bacterium]
METGSNTKNSGWLAIVYLLGFVLAIAIPAAILVWILPAYENTIVITAIFLILAIPSLYIGLSWHNPRWTPETRSCTKFILIIFSLGDTPFDLYKVISSGFNWRLFDWHHLVASVCFFSSMYVPFLIGRVISRRKTSSEAP